MTDSEKWKELCAEAAAEKDPQRLLELVQEINRILEEQENKRKRSTLLSDATYNFMRIVFSVAK
jgi:hypothetical protein